MHRCCDQLFYHHIVLCGVVLLLLVASHSSVGVASQPSSNVGPSGSTFHTANTWSGYQLAAFTDLNADRRMDIVLLDAAGVSLSVVLAPEQEFFKFGSGNDEAAMRLPDPIPLFNPALGAPIRAVVAADFNADSVVDLLLLSASVSTGPYDAHIAYGSVSQGNISFVNMIKLDRFVAQPLVCDINSDMVSDVYGQTVDGKRVVYFGGSNQTKLSAPYVGPTWSSLGYSIFGDLDKNSVPDIVTLVTHNGRSKLQLIYRDRLSVGLLPDTSTALLINLPAELTSSLNGKLGLPVLGDFDGDGTVELLLPACKTQSCVGSSVIYVYNFKKHWWTEAQVNWTPIAVVSDSSNLTWSLTVTPDLANSFGLAVGELVGPSVGDVDLDGLPDLGLALTYRDEGGHVLGSIPVVLLNKGPTGSDRRIKLNAHLLSGYRLPSDHQHMRQIAFFDHAGKGTLDTFGVSVNDKKLPTTQLFMQSTSNDYYFLKVTVLNGLCASPSTCPGKGFGLYVPGISTSYSTESASGYRQLSAALLGSQSCCGALQLPSIIYGLGPFANFVEHLFVAIPSSKEHSRKTSIPALIPNSEVFINPYPHDNPNKWTAYLYLRPFFNMKVVYIAIALVGVCLVLIVIISVLQYLEVREDRLEKQKEAQCLAM